MLSPKRTKFRKQHKGRIHGQAKGATELNFGTYGLKAMQPDRITARQIEAARRAITRFMRRTGRVWIRIFPDVPVSSKPAEVRMGGGTIPTLTANDADALAELPSIAAVAPISPNNAQVIYGPNNWTTMIAGI